MALATGAITSRVVVLLSELQSSASRPDNIGVYRYRSSRFFDGNLSEPDVIITVERLVFWVGLAVSCRNGSALGVCPQGIRVGMPDNRRTRSPKRWAVGLVYKETSR